VTAGPLSVAPFYAGWGVTNQRLVERIGALSREQLEMKAAPDLWPIWATAAHLSGARVYWLCSVLKEPGAEHTPFVNPGEGWEDDLTHPRQTGELVVALESSWKIVHECLERWTPEMLQDEFHRERDGKIQIHTRQSVLMRLLTHDAEHCSEISQTLAMHGVPGIDLWTGRAPLHHGQPIARAASDHRVAD
jgi:uncharacterized damage-inducible protein DinB